MDPSAAPVSRKGKVDMSGPTMEDVARAAGVSRSLVSLVFQDSPKVAPASRRRILTAATRLGYRPNTVARSLASKQVRTFGVLLNDLSNPFFAAVYDAVANSAEAAGYGIALGAGQRDPGRERAAIFEFLSHRVSGLILVSPRMSVAAISQATGGVPTVVVGRDVRLPTVDAVLNDEVAGTRAALDHLISLGHVDIAHVSGGRGAGAAERRRAYEEVMAASGLTARVIPGEFTEQAGQSAGRLLLKGPLPTAVFAANDMVAVGLMGAFMSAGLSIPDDIAIVGYDNLALSALSMISLTSVAQSLHDFGQAATDLLLDRIEGGREDRVRRQFQPELIIRRSTAGVGPRRLPRADW
jgi:DNA-binding LacI/PurR family transcriptional regulator